MKIEQIKTISRFEEIRDTWNELLHSSDQNSVFLTHQWFYSWWRWLSEGKSLEIFLYRSDSGTPVGIAPLMRENDILAFMASGEVTDYCDFIIRSGKEREFFESLLDFFRVQYPGVQKILLMNIKQTSKTLYFLPHLAAKYDFTCTVTESEVAPVLTLPASYEDFLALLSRKNRHDLRRKLKRVEELEGVRTVKVLDAVGLQSSINSFIQLHRRSDASKEEFWRAQGMADFFQEIALQFSPQGWVELLLMLHNEASITRLRGRPYIVRCTTFPRPFQPRIASRQLSVKPRLKPPPQSETTLLTDSSTEGSLTPVYVPPDAPKALAARKRWVVTRSSLAGR